MRTGWFITSRPSLVSANALAHTIPARMVKHVAHTAVTAPTSLSFFCRPLLSTGNRRSMANSRPPYTRNPPAANAHTNARKSADVFSKTAPTLGCAPSHAHSEPWNMYTSALTATNVGLSAPVGKLLAWW